MTSKIDVVSGRVTGTIPVGAYPRFVTVGDGAVWFFNPQVKEISKVDFASARVTSTFRIGEYVNGLAYGDGSLWITPRLADRRRRIRC